MDKENERLIKIKSQIAAFNEPYKQAVAINCYHIGDDNDYSCFLTGCTFALWKAGEKDKAYRLATTDPLGPDELAMEDFEQRMIDHEKFLKEEEAHQQIAWKFYCKD